MPATLLVTALVADQDQVRVVDVVNNTTPLSVEVDAAVVAGLVIEIVLFQCLQHLLETSIATGGALIGSGLTGGTYKG